MEVEGKMKVNEWRGPREGGGGKDGWRWVEGFEGGGEGKNR